jgi:hypothetical protein
MVYQLRYAYMDKPLGGQTWGGGWLSTFIDALIIKEFDDEQI